ncbi:MAG TPA: long-chain fatty acid--CoA ligase [Alphaproteobacteria bacterium]|nr:long-chain fatty acid--CoA ligase [Alphaproteobacteria bacterium]USO05046.1 MAG: long-chain fatty acid--CoA ligase [Rhodospirillales bacterium]HOO81699.1 long-chain fatty acid--CoA ligase [Alphaproteobacteria bacterium]
MTEQNYPWLETYPPKPDWHMEISPGLMTEVFDQTAARSPNTQAFDFLGKTYDWAALHAAVNKFAAGLQALGVTKGAKVGLFLPNCPLSLIAYYGILKTGGTVVNFNPLYARDELAAQIEDSETDIMVTLDLAMLMDKMEEMLSDTRLSTLIVGTFTDYLPFPKNLLFPIVKSKDIARLEASPRIILLGDFLKNDGQVKPVEINPLEDIAVLQYTGGTTGTPKAAMLTHMNIYANAVQAYANFPDPQGHEKMLAVLPFFHVFAMTVCLNMAVLAGMEIVTIPRFDLNDTLDIIQKKKPNYMCGVPAIFSAINNHPKLKNFDLSSLDFCISGGAPLPVEVKKKFETKTGCTVVEGYGLTESSPVATVNPPFGENVAGSIGLPLPQTIIEIIDPDDQTTPMVLGERGEVCIRGPQVMKGYFKRPNETANVLRPTDDGGLRLHTGDIAYMDERGYTYIVDRIKDLIITNGYNVYPRHVEEAIYKHPNVEECIVAGLPDPNRGEIVKAWIKLKEGHELTAEDLKSFLDEKISKIEMPKRIEFRDKPLPKTMIGKLSRKDVVAEELGEV